MDALVATWRRQRALAGLVGLFAVSGATGLVYQTLWERQLHLVFGTSTFALSTVLTAFMAGLALGGAAAGRLVARLRAPLRVYGLLEIGIGAFALAFPMLLSWVEPLYLAAARAGDLSPWAFAMVQGLLAGGLLVIPTAAMGATLPLLVRFAAEGVDDVGDRVGLLYAVNTAGAVAGTWLAGFVLLPGVGLSTTTWIAAIANLSLGVGAIALERWAGGVVPETSTPPTWTPPDARASRAVLISVAFAGFAALVLEVAWFRVLGLMLGASAYAFSTMLLAFLVGIALGGRLGGPWADRAMAQGGVPRVLRTLALVQLGVGVASVALMHVYQELPYWYVGLFDALDAKAHPQATWAVSTLLAGLVMTPPAVLMGAAFPLAVRAAVGGADDAAPAAARVYAANTAGGVLGAALAGFVLLPTLQVTGTVLLAAGCDALAGASAWLGQRERGGRQGVAALVLAAAGAVVAVVWPPAWDPMMMTAGMYKYVTSFHDHSRQGIRDYAVGPFELIYYREGVSSVVTVARNPRTGNIWLANNGKVDASTSVDMPTQIMVSLLPMQFVDTPDDVLVIGLASGITAGAAAAVDEIARLDVVELEPAIVEAAHFFDAYNGGVLDDPRTNLVLDDGRNHVLRTPPATYDVVVSEPSNPWITGVSNLFTAEFFALGKSRLKDGGVWAQWVQLYGMDDADLKSLLGTFADTYDHVLCYTAAEDADLVLVGSDRPLVPTVDAAASLWRWPDVADLLESVHLAHPTDVLGTLLLDDAAVRGLAGDAVRNTDDNRRIEYAAPLNLHRDTQAINLPLLARHAIVPLDVIGDDPETLAGVATAYHREDDVDRAVQTMLRAGLSLPEGDPRRAAWVEVAFGWYAAERIPDPEELPEKKRLYEGRFLQEVVSPLLSSSSSSSSSN